MIKYYKDSGWIYNVSFWKKENNQWFWMSDRTKDWIRSAHIPSLYQLRELNELEIIIYNLEK